MSDKSDAILCYNYRQSRNEWDNIPTRLWHRLIQHRDIFNIDGIGFQNIQSTEDSHILVHLANLLQLTYDIGRYRPYHGESADSVAVFALNDEVLKYLYQEDFDQWTKSNQFLPIDEILLFSGTSIRIQAVPYENLVFFYSLSKLETQALLDLDTNLRDHIYVSDMSRRLTATKFA